MKDHVSELTFLELLHKTSNNLLEFQAVDSEHLLEVLDELQNTLRQIVFRP